MIDDVYPDEVDYDNPMMWDEEEEWRNEFADPNGRSALRAATPDNPRIHPCPTCGRKNKLTQKDVDLGYQCDQCSDRDEGRGY